MEYLNRLFFIFILTCSPHDSRICGITSDARAFEPIGKFQNKKHVGELRLPEGLGLVEALLQIEIVQIDAGFPVVHVHQEDDPARSRLLEQVQQQVGQQEVTEMICRLKKGRVIVDANENLFFLELFRWTCA